jgi:hypothetical protein
MGKTLHIELNVKEYKLLLQSHLLGASIINDVKKPNMKKILQLSEITSKLCKVGYENRLEDFRQLKGELYAPALAIEEAMQNIFNKFIKYVSDGDRDEVLKAMKEQFESWHKKEN